VIEYSKQERGEGHCHNCCSTLPKNKPTNGG
jgi:hypothetical protein